MEKYTIKELSEILGISYQATNKKVKKQGFKTIKESFKGNLTTFVFIGQHQLKELIEETEFNKKKQLNFHATDIRNNETVVESEILHNEDSLRPNEYLTFIKGLTEDLNNLHERLHETNEMRLESEKRLYLLEDKKTSYETLLKQKEQDAEYYKNEYFKLQQEIEKYNKIALEKENQIRELELTLQEKEKSLWNQPLKDVFKKL